MNHPEEQAGGQPVLALFHKFAFAMLLIILVFVIFSNTLTNGFVFDDVSMIKTNPAVRSARYISLYFARPFFSIGRPVTGPTAYDYYRPLVFLSYMIDYSLWGLSPGGYHLSNIILQSLAVVLVFLVFCRLGLSGPVSFCAAGFFAVHPALADSVAGVSGRSDPLCAVFLLTALYCYLRARRNPGEIRLRLLSAYLGAYTLALFTKENAIAFPLLITAYEFVRTDRRRDEPIRSTLTALLPSYGVSVLYFFYRMTVVPGNFRLPDHGMELARRAATAAVVASRYLLVFLLPHDLSFETFTVEATALLSLQVIFSFAVLGAMLAAAVILRKRSPKISFFLLWFFIFLLPFSYFFLFNPEPLFFTPPHFLYFPAMGLAAASAILGEKLVGTFAVSKGKKASAAACVAASLCLFGVQTVHRNREWKDDFTFFSDVLQHNPPSARAQIGMANALLNRGQAGYALARYAKAYELAKSFPRAREQQFPNADGGSMGTLTILNYYAAAALAGLGDAYFYLGEAPAALKSYESAVRENAFDATIQFRLARAYEFTGNFANALDSYRRTLRLDQNFADAATSSSIVLMKEEVYEQAKRVYLTSHLTGREESADAIYSEAVMLHLSGKRASAEALLRKVLEIAPMHFGANLALGQMLSERGLDTEALGNFSLAFAVTPTSAVAAKELSLTSLVLRDTAAAVQWAAKVYELAPDEDSLRFEENVNRLAARPEE